MEENLSFEKQFNNSDNTSNNSNINLINTLNNKQKQVLLSIINRKVK